MYMEIYSQTLNSCLSLKLEISDMSPIFRFFCGQLFIEGLIISVISDALKYPTDFYGLPIEVNNFIWKGD